MAQINTSLLPRGSWQENLDWQRQSGAAAIARGFEAGIQSAQFQQQQALRLKQLELQSQQLTMMNEARLQRIEDAQAELDDMPLLQEYAKNPDAGIPAFKSPKSYQKLSAIDLSRSRSELGRQTAEDLKNFNLRLSKVAAKDRFVIAELQRNGAPQAEIWDALDTAEARQREQTKTDKTFAPTEISKLYNEAEEAESAGKIEEAKVLRTRAETLARGGRETSVQTVNIPLTKFKTRVQELNNIFKQGRMKPEAYSKALDEATAELEAAQNAPFASPQTTAPPPSDPLGIRP